jgi:antitoxin VapB
MALFVKDREVDRLAERLATLQRTSKTEVVRQALRHELERIEGVPSLVEQGVAFAKALRSRSKIASGQPADKAFIDGLYDLSDVR